MGEQRHRPDRTVRPDQRAREDMPRRRFKGLAFNRLWHANHPSVSGDPRRNADPAKIGLPFFDLRRLATRRRRPTYPPSTALGYTGPVPSLGEAMIRPRPLAAGAVHAAGAPFMGLKRYERTPPRREWTVKTGEASGRTSARHRPIEFKRPDVSPASPTFAPSPTGDLARRRETALAAKAAEKRAPRMPG